MFGVLILSLPLNPVSNQPWSSDIIRMIFGLGFLSSDDGGLQEKDANPMTMMKMNLFEVTRCKNDLIVVN